MSQRPSNRSPDEWTPRNRKPEFRNFENGARARALTHTVPVVGKAEETGQVQERASRSIYLSCRGWKWLFRRFSVVCWLCFFVCFLGGFWVSSMECENEFWNNIWVQEFIFRENTMFIIWLKDIDNESE